VLETRKSWALRVGFCWSVPLCGTYVSFFLSFFLLTSDFHLTAPLNSGAELGI
jgi:hypothetical protein